MKQSSKQLTLLLFVFLIGTMSQGQNLSTDLLTKIQNTSDFSAITTLLAEKGFKKSREENAGSIENTGKWYFQPFIHSGEDVSSLLIKSLDSSHKAKTTFFLYNPFYYKDFITNLINARYRLRGTKYIDGHVYYVFKNKRNTFMTTERTTSDKMKYFEINLQAN